jgi:YVTN family beta-propeller protein
MLYKYARILNIVAVLGLGFLVFFARTATATPSVYYFNNAVNTSPSTLGNYWTNSGHTTPASTLPDFSVDEVNIASGATFNGSATFNGGAVNDGTVTGDASFYDTTINNGTVSGNATFYGDTTETYGTVSGTKVRRYNSSNLPADGQFRDFVSDGPWTIIADGVVVNLITMYATVDDTVSLSQINSGSFVYISFLYARANGSTLEIAYDQPLDTGSVPSTTDFAVAVNGSAVGVSAVGVSGSVASLTISTTLALDDIVTVTYTPGTNPITSDVLGIEVSAQIARHVSVGINAGNQPQYSIAVGTDVYVGNFIDDTVSVVDSTTDTISTTITSVPQFHPHLIGNKIFTNLYGGSTVKVINLLTNAVSATINVGNAPNYPVIVGTKLYTNNFSAGTVSVINTSTNAVSSTITVGSGPYYSTIVGTKVYVTNQFSNTVSVIDTATDTVSSTITVGSGPIFISAVGPRVYVGNGGSNSISVIDSTTDSVIATISSVSFAFGTSVGTKLYAGNAGTGSIKVIDTNTNTVTATIAVGGNTSYTGTRLAIVDDKIFAVNVDDDTVSVIDTNTDTVIDTIDAGDQPFYMSVVDNKVYVSNLGSDNITVIDANKLPSQLPNLTSFSSTTASGTYGPADTINITANFGKTLLSGSTMTVLLNTGASVTLNSVSGTTLVGTYTVASGDRTPDLSVVSVTSASVSDTSGHTRTSYSIPFSIGSFIGENSKIARNIGDSKNIVVGSYAGVTVGSNPYQVSVPITVSSVRYVYVANQGGNSVSVVRLSDNTVTATISVGSEPYGMTPVTISGTTYLYVANILSNTVSVINTSTNTVAATISVGVKPYYAEHIGTTVYVTNGRSNTVSVINANTNTVSATISVGSYPRGIKAHGTDLYVANYGDEMYGGSDSVSVIDSLTNTISATVVLPRGSFGPRGVTVSGSNVYVANYRSHNVSVINTATNAITDTIAVGNGPRGMAVVGSNVYVENFDDGTVSVIDTGTNTVTSTVTVGHSPSGVGVVDTDLYISRFQDGRISILDTTTGLLRTLSPVVSTQTPTTITNAGAYVQGTVVATGSENATTEGFHYGTTTAYGSTVSQTGSYGTGTFSLNIGELSASTTYHFRAFATNSYGTGYGSDLTFTTGSVAPSGGGSSSGGYTYIPPATPVVVPPPVVVTPPPTVGNSETTSESSSPDFQFVFTKTLKVGDTGGEVKELQKYLNAHGFIVAKKGAGSPGHETEKFGRATKSALIKFQEAHKKEILTPFKLKYGTGLFGPSTRAYIKLTK